MCRLLFFSICWVRWSVMASSVFFRFSCRFCCSRLSWSQRTTWEETTTWVTMPGTWRWAVNSHSRTALWSFRSSHSKFGRTGSRKMARTDWCNDSMKIHGLRWLRYEHVVGGAKTLSSRSQKSRFNRLLVPHAFGSHRLVRDRASTAGSSLAKAALRKRTTTTCGTMMH